MNNRLIMLLETAALVGIILFKEQPGAIGLFIDEHPTLRPLVNFGFFLVVLDLLRRALNYAYFKKNKLKSGELNNFHYGINNIAKFLVALGVIVSLFGLFGIDVMTLITSLSIVAAAIAIVTREYLTDFLVGIYFSFSKNFEINDYVQLGEHRGKILELQMLKLKLLNDDDDIVIVPNSKVYNNEIVNHSMKDIRSMSIDFQIDIRAVDSIESLETDLIGALSEFVEFIETDSYNLKIVEMRKDYIDIKFQYRLKRIDQDLQRKIRKKTVRAVFSYIAGRRIE